MKVVHLSTSDSGGAGIAASRLHKGLLRAGIDSSFVSLQKHRNDIPNSFSLSSVYFKNLPLQEKIKYFIDRVSWRAGLKDHPYFDKRDKYLYGRPPGFELFSIPDSAYDLQLLDLVINADIVHLHWVTEGFLDYGSFFRNSKKKFLWTLHDMNPFTGGCHHSDDCNGFVQSCTNCPQLAGTLNVDLAAETLKIKSNSLANLTDRQLKIVSPSKWMMEQSAKSYLFRRFSQDVIPNPVDESIYFARDKKAARKNLGLSDNDCLILFIAKDVDNERKGIRYLESALESIDIVKNLVVCSVGNSGNRIAPGKKHVDFGYVDNEEKMAEIYSAADVFVLPSLAENLPNTICESLMCGTPVVAFNVGGIPSLIDNANGVLVELKNSKKLGEAIERVANRLIQFDSNVIAKDAASKFAVSSVVEKYLSVYRDFFDA